MRNQSEEEGRGRCPLCCRLIFTLGLPALSLWLLLHNSTPVFSIEAFDAFAPNRTADSSQTTKANLTLRYDLKLKNRNFNKRIYYDALNLAFYYKSNLSYYLIGNATYPAFRQGYSKSTHRVGSFDATTPGVKWENATVVFGVELATAVRYKNIFKKSKRHRLMVAADLQINDQGSLVKTKKNKGIKLSSGTVKIKGCFDLVGILGILLFIHFW